MAVGVRRKIMGSEEALLQIQIAKATAITKSASIMFTEGIWRGMKDEAYDQAKKFADKAFKKIEKEWE